MPIAPHVLLVLALAFICVPLTPRATLAWEFTASGEVEALDRAEALVFDRHDNVIAAGTLQNALFAVKLHRTHGHALWRFWPGRGVPGGASERASAVALDQVGHVILAAMTVPEGAGQFTVVKLDKETGLPHWINRIGEGHARAVVVDRAGDVIAAGLFEGGMGIFKLRGADGVELWRAQPSGGAPGGLAHALALDGAGNAVAAGFLTQPSFDDAFAVVELAGSDGSERWRHLISDSTAGHDEAIRVAVDSGGDVVAVGIVRVATAERLRREFTVVKLVGADGTLRWRRDVTANQNGGDPRALGLDATDEVIVAGATFDAVGSHGDIIKLAGFDGSEQWRARDDDVSADALAVNAAGDIAVAGVVFGPHRFDMVVRKLSGATGAESWRTVRDGTAHGDDTAVAVAFDADANVAVVGELVEATTNANFAVVKLRGSDGTDF